MPYSLNQGSHRTEKPLPRNDAGEVILARADFAGDGKIDAWQCTDCREEYKSLYRLLRHLARNGDDRVVIHLEDGEITRMEPHDA